MRFKKPIGRTAGSALLGVTLGFVASLAAGCESDSPSPDCQCWPARVGATTLGKSTSDDGEFPSLEDAWLQVQRLTEEVEYDPENPAAILEYLDGGQFVRVKFAVFTPPEAQANGGAGGARR